VGGGSEPWLPPSKFTAGYTVDESGQAPRSTSMPPATPTPGAAAVGSSNSSARGSNSLAIVSLVTVLLFGVFVVPATIPMGLVARSQIRRRGQSGSSVANATLVVSGAYAFIAVIAVVLWLLIPADGR
jgi:Domain of unknown function (DUF4190)